MFHRGGEKTFLSQFSAECLSLTLQVCDTVRSSRAHTLMDRNTHTHHLKWQTNATKHLFLALSPISLLDYSSVGSLRKQFLPK